MGRGKQRTKREEVLLGQPIIAPIKRKAELSLR
jgi:hypothetical protein